MCPKGATHTSPGCNPGDGTVGMHPGQGWRGCMRSEGAPHTSPGCNPGDRVVGMHPGHGWWVCIRDTGGGYVSGTAVVGMYPGHGRWVWIGDTDGGYGGVPVWGWGGAWHESQGVALGCHMLPRWGRNRSRASPPNPRAGRPQSSLFRRSLRSCMRGKAPRQFGAQHLSAPHPATTARRRR